MKVDCEKDKIEEFGYISGQVKGWATESWSGEAGFPEHYQFKIYSPKPNTVKVDLVIWTSAGHSRVVKDKQRADLKRAIARHYQDRFPDCLLVLHDL